MDPMGSMPPTAAPEDCNSASRLAPAAVVAPFTRPVVTTSSSCKGTYERIRTHHTHVCTHTQDTRHKGAQARVRAHTHKHTHTYTQAHTHNIPHRHALLVGLHHSHILAIVLHICLIQCKGTAHTARHSGVGGLIGVLPPPPRPVVPQTHLRDVETTTRSYAGPGARITTKRKNVSPKKKLGTTSD